MNTFESDKFRIKTIKSVALEFFEDVQIYEAVSPISHTGFVLGLRGWYKSSDSQKEDSFEPTGSSTLSKVDFPFEEITTFYNSPANGLEDNLRKYFKRYLENI